MRWGRVRSTTRKHPRAIGASADHCVETGRTYYVGHATRAHGNRVLSITTSAHLINRTATSTWSWLTEQSNYVKDPNGEPVVKRNHECPARHSRGRRRMDLAKDRRSRISHRRIVVESDGLWETNSYRNFRKRQKWTGCSFRSGPFFVKRREPLRNGFGEPLQGAPCRQTVCLRALQHIDDGRSSA